MYLLKKLKRQMENIFVFNALSISPFLKRAVTFPIDLYLRNGKSSPPLNIVMDITYRCNLKCPMCFLKDEVLNRGYSELSSKEIKSFVSSVRKFNPSFYITGGEPLVRKDIFDILGYIKSKRLRCGLNTNGILLDEKRINELIDSKVDYVIFSIDGPREIHDKIRGKGAFEKTASNIRMLQNLKKSKKPRVMINCVISESNVNKLEDVLFLAKDLKVDALLYNHISYLTEDDIKRNKAVMKSCFNEELSSCINRSSPKGIADEVKKKVVILKKLAKKNKVRMIFKPDLSESQIEKWYSNKFCFVGRCMQLWNIARITPSGDMYPCAPFFMKLGNVKNSDFNSLWNSRKFVEFRKALKKHKVFPACNRCCKM